MSRLEEMWFDLESRSSRVAIEEEVILELELTVVGVAVMGVEDGRLEPCIYRWVNNSLRKLIKIV